MAPKKQKLIRKSFFLLLFSFCMAMHAAAQFAASGTEFYVAFGKNKDNATVDNVVLTLRITGQADTDVTLSFTENSSLNTTFHVEGGKITDYTLTAQQAAASYSGLLTHGDPLSTMKKSIRVTSTELITLVAINSASASVEASLVWPVESWGTEYYNIGLAPLSNSGVTGGGGVNNCNGFLLIAKEDGTRVQISGTVIANFTLQAGEMYHYYFSGANTMGEHIVSDKPIAFFQTNTQATVRSSASTPLDSYNYNLEQLPPTNQWGTKFIAPANAIGDGPGSNPYAGFFRIFAKERNTTVTVKFPDNSVKTYTIAANAENGYADITLNISNLLNNINNNPGMRVCYITSDKPVSICSIHTASDVHGDNSQPAIAWLPPLEQKTRNVLMSPLDFNNKYVYQDMYHFCTVIVPAASEDNTTISVDGGPAQPIENFPQFQWIERNVGGSGYSVGQYYFGMSNHPSSGPVSRLNTTALIDNPDGLIVLAYGQGSYTKYFYTVGSAFRDLTASFTVNDEVYYDVDGKAYCNTSDFTFVADSRDPNALNNIVWTLNGVEIPDSRDLKTVNVNDLSDGYYTAEMSANNITYTTHFFVGGSPVIWTPEANSGDDKNNWENASNWTPALVPTSCHTVFIPGNSTYYPILTSPEECYDIYFMQGAELGRPDLLTYKKAHVQLNFDLKQSAQQKNDDKDLVIKSTDTEDRMLYSAAVSATPIERERWYMLSSPLRKVVTGDLSFGGFPLTFLMKFGPVEKDGTNYNVGNWTTTYTSLTEPVASNPTDGFAFYMYGYGNSSNDNTGCIESGAYADLGDLEFLPNTRAGLNYGIKETNGILELPFFEDSTLLYAHRTQIYNSADGKSTFYPINDGTIDPEDFNKILEPSVSVSREADNGNYRFAPETLSNTAWSFPSVIYHSGAGLNGDDEFLVGNPYMSSIDMVAFISDNTATVCPQYRIWNGTDFISYSLQDNSFTSTDPTINPDYVAPGQGFFLKTVNSFNGDNGSNAARFDVTKISTVRPSGSAFNLRSGEAEKNILRIKAENRFAASYAVIGYRDKAGNGYVRGEDVEKLFSPYGYVPSVYSLADDVPTDINFINNDGEAVIPLGIKTDQTGEIRLTFTGMDNYVKASKIELIDALEGRTVDLTGKSSGTYTFDNTKKGTLNGRFILRIGTSMTALPNVTSSDNLYVYGNSKEIFVISSLSDPVLQVIAYDFQGKKIFESASGATHYLLPEKSAHSPLIIKVITKNQVKSVKVNYEL
ncbi:MAG: IgGFc-binding protein [Candidatus Azobacteroides sp.]|nr:IgGFc-binding protein [Candidatus Azobacteroides sp.]